MLVRKYGKYMAVVLAVAISVTACATSSSAVRLVPDGIGRLTAESDAYQIHAQWSRIVMYNAASGTNNREIYWDRSVPESSAATVCTTWATGIGIAQNGIAFRIQQTDGGYNAIVLERNIWANIYWVFNVALFYTGREYNAVAHAGGGPVAKPYDGPTGINLASYLGTAAEAVYPLRVCASLDGNDVLRFAVAKGTDAMPPLDNPGQQGGSWRLDIAQYYHDGQGKRGRTGIYAGHIPVGTSLVYDDVTLSCQSG